MRTGDDVTDPAVSGATTDTWPFYQQCLLELLNMLNLQRPEPRPNARHPDRDWRHDARRLIRATIEGQPVRAEWLQPLVLASIHEPDPSFCGDFVAPAVAAFGRRAVMVALLGHFETGTDHERAGVARAIYHAGRRPRSRPGTREPTPESQADIDALADLWRQWREVGNR